MPIEVSITATLSKQRAHTDKPYLGELYRDIYRRENGVYEMLKGSAAPTATARTVRPQYHDAITGSGILRAKCGEFRGPLTKTTDSTSEISIAAGDSNFVANEDYASNKEVGFAVVSPGIASIRVEMLFKASVAGAQVRVKELVNGNTSSWVDVPTAIDWLGNTTTMSLTLTATVGGSALLPLDLEVKTDGTSVEIKVYRAFAYEYRDQA